MSNDEIKNLKAFKTNKVSTLSKFEISLFYRKWGEEETLPK